MRLVRRTLALRNDGEGVAASLRRAGWIVTVVYDATGDDMFGILREFADSVKGSERRVRPAVPSECSSPAGPKTATSGGEKV